MLHRTTAPQVVSTTCLHEKALIRLIRVMTTILQHYPARPFSALQLRQSVPSVIPLSTLYRYLAILEREGVLSHEDGLYSLNHERYRALVEKCSAPPSEERKQEETT